MKKILLLQLLISIVLIAPAQEVAMQKLPAGKAPVIDGTQEALWDTVKYNNISYYNTINALQKDTAYWRALYNDTALFILVSVKDNHHCDQWCSGQEDWRSDKPDLYFDVNSILKDGLGPSTAGSGHPQICPGFQQNVQQFKYYGWLGSSKLTYSYKISGEDYIYEYAILWSELRDKNNNSFIPAAGKIFGYNLIIIDRDSINQSASYSNWSDGRFENMDNSGKIVIAAVDPKIKLFSNRGAVIVKDTTIKFGVVGANKKKQTSFTIKNYGSKKLVISSITATGSGFSVVQPKKLILGCDDTTSIVVAFQSNTTNNYTGKVQIICNDPANATFAINFSSSVVNSTIVESGNIWGTWTKAKSPYLIYGDVTVADTSKLIVEPGTQILFQGYYSMRIKGCIKAIGSAKDSIFFMKSVNDTIGFADNSTTLGGWHGIKWLNGWEMFNQDTSVFRYCVFKYSKSVGTNENSYGGAIYIDYFRKVKFYNSLFYKNIAVNSGGAICAGNVPEVVIINCSFIENYADGGGAIKCWSSKPTILYSKFVGNSANWGGCIGLDQSKSNIQNCQFTNNFSNGDGGAINLYSSDDYFGNNLITNNTGGAISIQNASPIFVNNTIVNNLGANNGGVVFHEISGAEFFNNIIWGNKNSSNNSSQITISNSVTTPTFTSCIIQTGTIYTAEALQHNAVFTDTLGKDPLFKNPTVIVGNNSNATDANWVINGASPAINKGVSNDQVLKLNAKDYYNQTRILNGLIDLGACEGYIGKIDAVDTIRTNTTWTADTITVNKNIFIKDNVTLCIVPGVKVIFYGNYGINVRGTLKAIGTKNKPITFTIADTTGFSNYFSNAGGWHYIDFDNDQWGAKGTMNDNDTSYLQHCIIQYAKNTTLYQIGGAANIGFFSKLVISDCVFRNNAGLKGGALFINNQSNPIIRNNKFYNNYSKFGGGAIAISQKSKPFIINNIITNNYNDSTLWPGGGGLLINNSNPIIVGNIISNNYSFFGGGIFLNYSEPTFSNNTITFNYAGQQGGGILTDIGSNAKIYNTVFWGNKAALWAHDIDNEGDVDFYNCNINDLSSVRWHDSANIISKDPSFVKTSYSSDHSTRVADYSSDIPNAQVKKVVGSSIDIDGMLTEDVWSKANKNVCTRLFKNEDKYWHGNDDEAGFWQAVWNDSGIFIAVSVTDDINYIGDYGPGWAQDKVEIYLNMNVNKPRGKAQNIDGRYVMDYNADNNSVEKGWLTDYPQLGKGKVRVKTFGLGNYSQEFFLPWKLMIDSAGTIFKPDGIKELGFDVYIVDNDGPNDPDFGGVAVDPIVGSRTRLVWSNDGKGPGANENWNNMADAGLIKCIADSVTNYKTTVTGLDCDFNITAVSGNINNGDNTKGVNQTSTDVYGNPRISNTTIDIGAAENKWKQLEFIKQPTGGTYCEGDTVILSVLINDTVSYTWMKNGIEIPGATSHILALSKLKAEMQGNYACRVENSYGKLTSNNASLIIKVAPSLTAKLQDQLIQAGSKFTIEPKVSGTEPFTYTWLKDTAVMTDQLESKIQFASFSIDNEGSYSYKITNSCGTAMSDTLNLFTVPQIALSKIDSKPANCEGDSIQLSASINFPATIQWQKNGKNIDGAVNTIKSYKYPPTNQLSVSQPNAIVYKTNSPVTINGKIDGAEWDMAYTNIIDKKNVKDSAFKNENDLAGYWKAAFDNNGIYILVNVTKDDYHYPSGKYGFDWEKDLIEIYLDMNDTLNDGGGTSINYKGHYQLSCPDSTSNPTIWWGTGSKISVIVDSAAANTSTIEEVFIPWKDIPDKNKKIYNPESGKPIGFDVTLSDNDGLIPNTPARRRKVWSNDESVKQENYLDMDKAGRLLFKKDANTATYSINKVAKTDEGNYTCVVQSEFGKITSNQVLISISSPPGIISQTQSQWVFDGSVFNLITTADGSKPLQYKWQKDNVVLSDSLSQLRIDSFITINEGNYICQVTNLCGSATTQAINLKVAPELTNPSGASVCENDTFQLAVLFNDNATYQWSKDGKVVGSNSKNYNILKTTSKNIGNYQCKVSNTNGYVLLGPIQLTIRKAPSVEMVPAFTYVDASLSAKLEANATGDEPFEYQWYMNGIAMKDSTAQAIVFDTVTITNEKAYKCLVKNSCGSIETNETKLVIAPQICVVTIDFKEDSNRNKIVWEKNSSVLYDHYNIYREGSERNKYIKLGTVLSNLYTQYTDMTIRPNSQSARYKITATDAKGNETALEACAPHQTVHLLVSPGIPTGVNLDWNEYIGFEFVSYVIYKSIDKQEFTKLKVVSSTFQTYTDEDADNTKYLKYMVAVERDSACYADGRKKAGAGPFASAYSNMEDNARIKWSADNIENSDIQGLKVFPNPFTNTVEINYRLERSSDVTITLHDFSGRAIKTITEKVKIAGNYTYNLGDGLQTGIYFLNIRVGNKAEIVKVVKIK